MCSNYFQLASAELARTLRESGSVVAGTLPPPELGRVLAITDTLAVGEYNDFDHVPEVRALIRSPATLNVARAYLRTEPEIIECSLFVSDVEDPLAPVCYDSDRRFHFEDAGWHSLSLFVYLTDVSEDSGAHQVVLGTHRMLTLWDAIRGTIPEAEIEARYPHRIRTIVGPAGTLFFEDTSAIHRRLMHIRRHALLHILFA
jgi:hypothetical protein